MAAAHRRALAVLAATALSLTSCSLVGADSSPADSKDVVLVTHDSFVLPKKLIAQFEQQSGYHLVVHAAGDGGTLTNKLVLTQANPTGDVASGSTTRSPVALWTRTSSRGPTSRSPRAPSSTSCPATTAGWRRSTTAASA